MAGREHLRAQDGRPYDPDPFARRVAEARIRRNQVLAKGGSASEPPPLPDAAPPPADAAPAAPAPDPAPDPATAAPPSAAARWPKRARMAGVFLAGLTLGLAVAVAAVRLGDRGPAARSVPPAAPASVADAPAVPDAAPPPALPAPLDAAGPVPRLAAAQAPDVAVAVATVRPGPRPAGLVKPAPVATRGARGAPAAPAEPAGAEPPDLPRSLGALLRQLATNRVRAVPPGERNRD